MERLARLLVCLGPGIIALGMVLAIAAEALRSGHSNPLFAVPAIVGFALAFLTVRYCAGRVYQPTGRWWLGAVIGVPLVIQLALAIAIRSIPTSDYLVYWQTAVYLYEAREYVYFRPDGLSFLALKPPGVALYLATLYGLFGYSIIACQIANIVLVAFGNWLFFRLMHQLFGLQTAVAATFLLCCWPSRWLGNLLLGYDAPASVLMIAFWYTAMMPGYDRIARSSLGGLLAGGIALLRQPLLLVIAIYLAIRLITQPSRRMFVIHALPIVLGVGCALSIWGYRNLTVLGHPVISGTQGGHSFYRGFHPDAGRYYTNVGWNELVQRADGDELRMNDLGWSQGLAFVKDDPLAAAVRVLRKWYTLLESDHEPAGIVFDSAKTPIATKWRQLASAYCDAWYAWMAMTAVLLWHSRVRTDTINIALSWSLLAMLSAFVVFGMFESQPRYMVTYQCFWPALSGGCAATLHRLDRELTPRDAIHILGFVTNRDRSQLRKAPLSDLNRTELAVQAERAVLVCVLTADSKADPRNPLGELDHLAKTAGAKVIDYVIQRRDKPDPVHFIGAGKAQELCERAQANDATLIIFDHDLSPAQIRELEKATQCKIIDRSELILDIFASRAKTRQARLQVELAQLEYTAPRLRGMWTHLERIAGAGGGTGAGAVGGIGTRGPGERQIEIDRRLVGKRIALLKKRIREIDQRKVREIKSRENAYKISIVGYTNAGKSTLMNALTGFDTTRAEDKLFSTLDTKTRQWKLEGGMVALLSDTVGFVRDLPHHLVASFRATLEEAIHADLLLHVVDASSRTAEREMQAVDQVLCELGLEEQPRLVLLNKMDVVEDPTELQVISHNTERCMRISARTGAGMRQLHDYVLSEIRRRAIDVTVRTHPGDGRAISFLDKHAHVLARNYTADSLEMEIRIGPEKLQQLLTRLPNIEVIDAPHPTTPCSVSDNPD